MKHASLSRQTVVLPIRNQDVNVFCTKTCLVPFVKPFHSFKLKPVLYSYCLTKGISHVCDPPWFESEEAQQFVYEWRSTTVCLNKVAYFRLGHTPKKRAVHDALFKRELLKWNTLIKCTFLRWHYFGSLKHVMCEIFWKSLYIFKISVI